MIFRRLEEAAALNPRIRLEVRRTIIRSRMITMTSLIPSASKRHSIGLVLSSGGEGRKLHFHAPIAALVCLEKYVVEQN